MRGIVSQHIMQKGTNMDDMEKLLTIKDVQEHLQLGRNRVYGKGKIENRDKKTTIADKTVIAVFWSISSDSF